MRPRRVLVRCDGGAIDEIGTGHVVRGLVLAGDLRARFGSEVVFAMRPTEWCARVEAAGFEVEQLDETVGLVDELLRVCGERASEVLVLDDLGRTGRESRTVFGELQARGVVVLALDDPFHAAAADVSFNPAFPGTGAVHEGFDCSILPSDMGPGEDGLARAMAQARTRVFASFGGHDPGGAARAFLAAWGRAGLGLDCLVATPDAEALQAPPGVELVDSADLVELLPEVRVAVTNGGTTMLMAASFGAAVLAVAQYEHQAANARRLAEAGAAEFLGLASEIDYDALVARVAALFDDPKAVLRLGTAGRQQISGLGRGALVEAAQVVARLDWDSAFFDFPIACLFPRRLSPAILSLAESFCLEEQIECLYFLADAADKATHAAAEAAGFHCVDERWTYRATARAQPVALGADAAIRRGRPADAEALAAIAGDAYEASRYYFDRHFPRAACQRFYSDWIQKSLRGEFDHVVLVAESEAGEVAGYISCRALSPNLGRIGLVGIAPGSRGRGLGARLVAAALGWFAERDLVRVEVVTQGRNTPAQRLYERVGFELVGTELWFHRWFSK